MWLLQKDHNPGAEGVFCFSIDKNLSGQYLAERFKRIPHLNPPPTLTFSEEGVGEEIGTDYILSLNGRLGPGSFIEIPTCSVRSVLEEPSCSFVHWLHSSLLIEQVPGVQINRNITIK